MLVAYERLARSRQTPAEAAELTLVDALAGQLLDHLAERSVEIDFAHVHGAPSMAIQVIVSELLKGRLGFREEVVLSLEASLTNRPRPDFVYRLGDGRGIIAEVERGGTTTNNHDLKDLWKTHIGSDVQHLFLVVPQANWKEGGAARERPFPAVVRRLRAFFGEPRREIDVLSVHVFGYGRAG